jgi:hypothetical protein
MNWSTWGKELVQYFINTSITSTVKFIKHDQLFVFSNTIVYREMKVYCPILNTHCIEGALATWKIWKIIKMRNQRAISIALATSTLFRCTNPRMFALAYRMSTISQWSELSGYCYNPCTSRTFSYFSTCSKHSSSASSLLTAVVADRFEHWYYCWLTCH